jgi:hypothetical protein
MLKAASHPLRFDLLVLASHGVVHHSDAKRLAAADPASTSGGPAWHLAKLEKAGLLVRTQRDEYALSALGGRLLAAVGVLSEQEAPLATTDLGVTLQVEMRCESEVATALFPEDSELTLQLHRRVRDRPAGGASARVTRHSI